MFMRKRKPELGQELTPEQLRRMLEDYEEQTETMLSCVRILCYFIKDFTFDISDIHSEDFKKRMDELVDRVKTESELKAAA